MLTGHITICRHENIHLQQEIQPHGVMFPANEEWKKKEDRNQYLSINISAAPLCNLSVTVNKNYALFVVSPSFQYDTVNRPTSGFEHTTLFVRLVYVAATWAMCPC